jgi:hypothetical protein
MAPEPVPAPREGWRDALDAALLRRLARRAERPGLARPWQALAIHARHQQMAGGLPLAELLGRRAEILADGRAAWTPIVYAQPAAPPVARGSAWPQGAPAYPATRDGTPESASPSAAGAGGPAGAGHSGAIREAAPARPVVQATAARTTARTTPPPGSAPDTAPDRPLLLGPPPARRSPADTQPEAAAPADASARPGAALRAVPRDPAPPTIPSPVLPTGAPGPFPVPVPVLPAAVPVSPAGPGRTAHPPGTPGLPAAAKAPPAPQAPLSADAPADAPAGRRPSALPVVRPWLGREGDDRAPHAADPQAARSGPPIRPVVSERTMRPPRLDGASPGTRMATTGVPVPAPLPLAPAPALPRPAAVPAGSMIAGAGPATRPVPVLIGPVTHHANGAVPAARGPRTDRGYPEPRPRRPVLPPREIARVADKVQRKLVDWLAIEDERRGAPR